MSKWRRTAAAVVAMVAMSGAAVVTSTSSASAVTTVGTGTLTGTVLSPSGTPAISVLVRVLEFDGVSSWLPIAGQFTSFDGKYNFPNLPNDVTLNLAFTTTFSHPAWQSEWYNHVTDQAAATAIILAAGETRIIDTQLSLNPSISGKVLANDGSPLSASVSLFSPSTGASFFGTTAPDGSYSIPATPGTYVVFAGTNAFPPDQFAPEYYGQAFAIADATQLPLVAGAQLTGIDITLSPGAIITGRVLDANGTPLPGASGLTLTTNEPGAHELAGGAVADANGVFTIQGVPTGTYKYIFSDGISSGLAPVTVDITTVAGTTTTTDIPLAPGAFGIVTGFDPTGLQPNDNVGNSPLPCRVLAQTATGPSCGNEPFEQVQPNPNGPGFIIGPLSAGDYLVRAESPLLPALNPAAALTVTQSGAGFSCTVFTSDATGTGSCAPAAPLPLGSISGNVTGPDGVGLPGVQVSLEYTLGSTWTVPSVVVTDASGNYTMPRAWTGSYRVHFSPPPGRTDLAGTYWNSAGSVGTSTAAEPLVIAEGATIPGIDGRLDATSTGSVAITTNGVPVPSPFGDNVSFCRAPATAIPFIGRCSDNTFAIQSFFNGIGFSPVVLSPGTWTAQVLGFRNSPPFGPLNGAIATFTVAGGDTFTCSLDTEPTGPSSCTVAGATPPDTTPPVITPTVSPATPDGNNGWYRSDVSVHFQVDEPESPASLTTNGCGDASVTADQPATTYSCTATSAGGSAGPVGVTVQRDATAPTVSWSPGIADGSSFVFGTLPAAPTCAAVDALSGPNDCTVQGYSTAVGTHTLVATATDQAGNVGSASITYTVTPYRLVGFRAPVRPVPFVNFLEPGDDVRFQWQVFAGATELTSTSVVSSFTATPASCVSWIPTGAAAVDITVGNPVIRDLRRGVFSLKWEPTRRQRGCWLVTATTDDGSSLSARFRVK